MKLNNINSVYSLANILYGVTINPDNFEDVVLNGLQLIGNKHSRMYRYVGDTTNRILELPCNLSFIESVTIPFEDFQSTSDTSIFPLVQNAYYERYNEAWKWNKDPLYQSGKLLNYNEINNALEFDRDYSNVSVLYHGVIVDDDGLPLITDKELTALAAYAAYIDLYKKSLVLRDSNSFQIAQAVKQEWLRACSDARVPEHISQNEMNEILDARTRWDRKQYKKSFKPVN